MDAERDPFDELTALFTTEESALPQGSEHSSPAFGLVGEMEEGLDGGPVELPPMRITVAICGHLPVMAGLWVTQYADRVAEASGPTGLLRLEGGRCSLELFRTPSDAARMVHGCSMLDSIESVVRRVRRWIICVDERDAAESVRAGSDEVVVLTGADKPAVLAAYRLAKTAAGKARPDDELDLGLVVVGASEQRTAAVGGVLRTVAGEFMDRPLEVIDSIQRMDVVESARRMLFNEQHRVTPAEAVELLCELAGEFVEIDGAELEPPQPNPDPQPESPAQDVQLRYVRPVDDHDPFAAGNGRPAVRLSPAVPTVRMRPGSHFRDIRVLDIDLQSDADRVEEEVVNGFEEAVGRIEGETGGEKGGETRVETPVENVIDGLVGHFPEFTALEYRCPLASGVELAMDGQGRLHLLCRDEDLEQVGVASSWAAANETLIRMATSGLAPGGLSIVTDVVTDDADRIIKLHHTGVRLHLLSPIKGADGDQWVRAELNTEESSRIPG